MGDAHPTGLLNVITTKAQQPPFILNSIVGWALPNTRQTFQDMV
jgi:hypothetical protein